jgi:hypothetical protein
MGIDLVPVTSARGKALERVPTSGLLPLNQFGDPLFNWDTGLGELKEAIESAGGKSDKILDAAKEVTRAAIGRRVANLPLSEANISPALGFAGAGQAAIGASVAGSRVLKRKLESVQPRITYKLLNPESPTSMATVYKRNMQKLVDGEGNLTQAGKALLEIPGRVGGMAASAGASRLGTMRGTE